jgi:hypothetical protein
VSVSVEMSIISYDFVNTGEWKLFLILIKSFVIILHSSEAYWYGFIEVESSERFFMIVE